MEGTRGEIKRSATRFRLRRLNVAVWRRVGRNLLFYETALKRVANHEGSHVGVGEFPLQRLNSLSPGKLNARLLLTQQAGTHTQQVIAGIVGKSPI